MNEKRYEKEEGNYRYGLSSVWVVFVLLILLRSVASKFVLYSMLFSLLWCSMRHRY